MQQVNQKSKAGQEIRILDIAADTGKFGIYECLHDCYDGALFSQKLKKNTKRYYGTAGRDFIKKIIDNKESIIQRINELTEEFIEEKIPFDSDGQVKRALHKFALIAAAGELATEWGITNWPAKESFKATSIILDNWIKNRGGYTAQEIKAVLKQIRHFLEKHGDSRFANWDEQTFNKIVNRAGFKKYVDGEIYFYILPEVFKREICAGFDYNFVSKVLLDKKWLIPDSEGNFTRSENLPDCAKNMRCYKLDGEIVFSEDI